MKERVTSDFATRDIAEAFLKANPECTLTITECATLLAKYNKAVANKIIDGHRVHLPFIGDLVVQRSKKKIKVTEDGIVDLNGYPIDHKATKDLWASDPIAKANKQLIRHLNDTTDGFIGHIIWDKMTCKLTNQLYFVFRPSRRLKRGKLVESIKEDIYKYEERC